MLKKNPGSYATVQRKMGMTMEKIISELMRERKNFLPTESPFEIDESGSSRRNDKKNEQRQCTFKEIFPKITEVNGVQSQVETKSIDDDEGRQEQALGSLFS